MATSTITAPDTLSMFRFEKALTQDYTDFYAIFDNTKNAWVDGYWVRVPEGADYEDVETAFNGGDLITGL